MKTTEGGGRGRGRRVCLRENTHREWPQCCNEMEVMKEPLPATRFEASPLPAADTAHWAILESRKFQNSRNDLPTTSTSSCRSSDTLVPVSFAVISSVDFGSRFSVLVFGLPGHFLISAWNFLVLQSFVHVDFVAGSRSLLRLKG